MIDEKRLASMTNGIEELAAWLLDILREGAAALAGAPPDYWEELAGRMVDAKLGGIARRIRTWPALYGRPDGPRLLVAEIADLYLYIQAFRRFDQLPTGRRTDLLTTGGVNQKKETVRQQGKPIRDHWLVAGQLQGEEDNLKYRRTWLLGESTRRTALLLDYAWGRNDFAEHWTTGNVFSGDLVFYPSNYPQRALVASLEWSKRPYDMPAAFSRLENMLEKYAEALARNPWLHEFPCLLGECRVVRNGSDWFLLDMDRRRIPLIETKNGYWSLLALSAAGAVDLFGEWNGAHLAPLSVVRQQYLVSLTK